MSNPPTPPPLPPGQPQPPQPPPIRVQPLSYVPPAAQGRPGVLTAVAVLSIVVGSISMLASGATTLYGVVMATAFQVARTTTTVTTSSTGPSATVLTPTAPPAASASSSAGGTAADVEAGAGEDGMSRADRTRVVDALAELGGLSDVRRGHVDALLAKVGGKVLPLTGEALTARAVRANVTDAGRFPSGSGDASAGSDYFTFARGRVEVDDRHAVFYPAGQGEVVRAAADAGDTGGDDDATTEPGDTSAAAAAGATTTTASTPPAAFGTPLTAAQVNQVIRVIEGQTGRKLTAAQARTLRTQLQTRGQMLFFPPPAGSKAGFTGQIAGTVVNSGTVSFTTPTGTMTLYPGGGYTSTAGFAAGGLSSIPNVMTQGVLVIVSSALSLALAILLLVAGIATVRNASVARRLHLVYAYLKVPVGIAGLLAWGWLWYAFVGALPAGGASKAWAVAAIFCTPILLGLVYPVALLIVMHARVVKAYYGSVAPG